MFWFIDLVYNLVELGSLRNDSNRNDVYLFELNLINRNHYLFKGLLASIYLTASSLSILAVALVNVNESYELSLDKPPINRFPKIFVQSWNSRIFILK